MKNVLREVIHQDQAGFSPQRYLRNNIRILYNILEYLEDNPGKQVALIVIDSQKTFGNVVWEFLITTLEKINGNDLFTKMIRAVYKE